MNRTEFITLRETLRRAAMHVDHAIRLANELADDSTFIEAIDMVAAAWFGALRGELADARDALAGAVPGTDAERVERPKPAPKVPKTPFDQWKADNGW